jgi:hypothetical protein
MTVKEPMARLGASVRRFQIRRWVQRPDWLRAFLIACAVCVVTVAVNAVVAPLRAGSVWGEVYGVLATVLMFAALLLGVRRRTMRLGLGKTQTWVQIHVYGGALFMVLTLMHDGFRWPRERLTWWLLALSLWVTVSGLIGVVLRKWIPRLLTSGLRIEVVYDRVPELVADVKRRAEALAAAASMPVQDFYRENIAAALAAPHVRLIYYFDITGGIQTRMRNFDYLRKLLPPAERERFAELEGLYRTKLEIDAHYTLQRALRWWLVGHVPVSVLLALLVIVHLVAVLYY